MDSIGLFESAVKREVGVGAIPGTVAIVFDREEIRYESSYGRRSIVTPEPMTYDTIFWFASMTKAIVAAAAMQLVEQGRIQLDEPVGRFLPALASPYVLEGFTADGTPRLRLATEPITMRRLLTHTAGFSYDTWDPMMQRYMSEHNFHSLLHARKRDLLLPLVADPGERWAYGISIDWIGQLIEAVSGRLLRDYLLEHVLKPIGMVDTDFVIGESQRRRLARVHQRQPDGSLLPIEHEVSQTPEFYMGGGGLYGTGRDYAAFLQMLLNRGKARDGTAVLQVSTVDLMVQNQIGDLEAGHLKSVSPDLSRDIDFFPGMSQKWGLSFLINADHSATGRSAGSLSWAGLANTYYWVDLKKGVGALLMAQLFPFGDPTMLRLYDQLERAVYQCAAKP